jgi:hypothetical protein
MCLGLLLFNTLIDNGYVYSEFHIFLPHKQKLTKAKYKTHTNGLQY